jgi:hypothetical protein
MEYPLLSRILPHFQSLIPLLIYQNSNLDKPYRPNATLWKAKPDWLRQLVSIFQTNDKQIFWALRPLAIPNQLIMSSKVSVSGFTPKHRATKLPSTWPFDGSSVKVHDFECFFYIHALPAIPPIYVIYRKTSPVVNWATKRILSQWSPLRI